MTIDHRMIQDGLYDWMRGVVPELSEVYSRNQEVPQSAIPYGTFWIKNVKSYGLDTKSSDFSSGRNAGEELRTTFTGAREVCVYVDLYTNTKDLEKDALVLGERLVDSLRKESIKAPLFVKGLTFLRKDFGKQLSQLESGSWISRYSAELVFCTTATQEDFSGYIETIETVGTVIIDGEEVEIDGEITLP